MDESAAEEAGPRERSRRVRAVLVGTAVATAALFALLAPDNWPSGPGAVVVAADDVVLVEAPVEIGTDVEFARESADGGATITFPDGIPTDDVVAVTVQTRSAVSVGEVTVSLQLPDGREELVPVVEVGEDSQEFEARRRPTRDASVVLGLLGLVIVLWVSEAFPLFVTSLLIPVVLVATDVGAAADATAPFFNPIIVLFFAGFLMAEAMRRSGLDHRAAVMITAAAGRTPAGLFATMLGLTAFLSMWMSNTAAAVVLVPVAIAVTDPLDHRDFQRALVLGIAYASTIGGVGSAIGTPANQLAIEFLDQYGATEISFLEWFAYGLPMVVLFVPVMGAYLWYRRSLRFDHAAFAAAREVATVERARLGRPSRDEAVVLAVFGLVALGWVTQSVHDLHPGIVALAGAVALFGVGRLEPDDLGRISWPTLLTFGGGLTLGTFLVETGVSDHLATRLAGLADWPTTLAVLALAAVTLVLTTVASNTASAAILIPLAIPLATVIGVEPTTAVVVIAIASSIDFALVIGTPPTMVAYSTRLHTAGEIFRTGILLDLVGVVLLATVVTRIWGAVGLV